MDTRPVATGTHRSRDTLRSKATHLSKVTHLRSKATLLSKGTHLHLELTHLHRGRTLLSTDTLHSSMATHSQVAILLLVTQARLHHTRVMVVATAEVVDTWERC